MNRIYVPLGLLATMLVTSSAYGHGSAINITVIENRLVASHSPDAYAPPIFGQSDEFDDFSDVDSFPLTGSVILWDIPGLDIHNMSDTDNLSIEVLSRPLVDSIPGEHRLLWYWNPTSETVEPCPAEFHLFGTGARVLTLHPDDQESPPIFTLANQVAGETGFHNHSLVFYGLDDDAVAPAGVYGFYARFTSNSYSASDPFLLLFNYFSDNELLPSASLSIHEAATLPGDFDLDEDVDGRDFLAWQRMFNSTTRTVADASLNGVVDGADLYLWQEHYGEKFEATSPTSFAVVPEPATHMLISGLLILASLKRQQLS